MIKRAIAKSRGNDLAVVQFSGHGAAIDRQLYLFPHEVNPRTIYETKETALSFATLGAEILSTPFPKYGDVFCVDSGRYDQSILVEEDVVCRGGALL